MRFVLVLVVAVSAFVGACSGAADEPSPDEFLGAYQTTITLSGSGSQTLTDSLTILEGSTSDLILQSAVLGALRATIIGDTSFALEQQQIMLTDEFGNSFSVNVMGQGTVTDGVFNSTGTLSTSDVSYMFTMAGSRL